MQAAPVISIQRHRIGTDGPGITTLVCLHGCPLRCKFCINPESRNNEITINNMTVADLYIRTKVDNLYFLSSGGGICFGGGEPTIHSSFIKEFKKEYANRWAITIESSLNVSSFHISELLPIVDNWIIDIKDMNPSIYNSYCGTNNKKVVSNLLLLSKYVCDKVVIKVPLIPYYNSKNDMNNSIKILNDIGFNRILPVNYCLYGSK